MAVTKELKATAYTPQILIFVLDDSGSMADPCRDGSSKAQVASEAMEQVILDLQGANLSTTISRFYISIARFGDDVTSIAEIQNPAHIALQQIPFHGNSGTTDMFKALNWATDMLNSSLEYVRTSIPGFREAETPAPLIVFLSDGENTGPDVAAVAQKIHRTSFQGEPIKLVACGVGLMEKDFATMRTIASVPEYAVNIDSGRIGDFIAVVGTSVLKNAGYGVTGIDQAVEMFRLPGR
jgi:uncharacterized protein YegL